MTYFVYILENQHGARYIGQTANLELRLQLHNSGKVFSTRNKGFWKVAYQEGFTTRGEAMKRENFLKKQKGGDSLKRILNN